MPPRTCLALLAGLVGGAVAEEVHAQTLGETERLGRRLFEQSCGVCHTKPTLTSPLFGPQLSKLSLGGNAEAMRGVIGSGTPRMPGFKYHFEPAQIDAIVAYIKTLPPAPEAPAPAARPPRVQDN